MVKLPGAQDPLPELPDHETDEWYGPEERERRMEQLLRNIFAAPPAYSGKPDNAEPKPSTRRPKPISEA